MTTAIQEKSTADGTDRPVYYSALAVAVASIGVLFPGGLVPYADTLYTLVVLVALYFAVTRHPGVKEAIAAAPVSAKLAAKIVLSLFMIGQLWNVSAHTYPVATWTMYSHNPEADATVFRFDAVTASGDPVAFTPSATNRTLPAKMALVHLRRLSTRVYQTSIGADPADHEAAQDSLLRAIVAYVDLHNERSPDADPPVQIEVSQVVYDVTQDPVTVDSGERTLLLSIDLDES